MRFSLLVAVLLLAFAASLPVSSANKFNIWTNSACTEGFRTALTDKFIEHPNFSTRCTYNPDTDGKRYISSFSYSQSSSHTAVHVEVWNDITCDPAQGANMTFMVDAKADAPQLTCAKGSYLRLPAVTQPTDCWVTVEIDGGGGNTDTESSFSLSLPVIIGIVAGVVVLVAAAIAGVYWYRRRSSQGEPLMDGSGGGQYSTMA